MAVRVSLALKASSPILVTLENLEPSEPLTHLFLLYVRDGRCAFHYVPSLADVRRVKQTMTLGPMTRSTATLVARLAERLTETGLFHKEALAMARTWQQ